MNLAQAEELSGLVKLHFGLGEEPLAHFQENKEENLQKLAKLLAYLVEHDFQRLVQGMYRIDVPEAAFKQVIEIPDFNQMIKELTELVFEREMLKVKTRLWYKEKNKTA